MKSVICLMRISASVGVMMTSIWESWKIMMLYRESKVSINTQYNKYTKKQFLPLQFQLPEQCPSPTPAPLSPSPAPETSPQLPSPEPPSLRQSARSRRSTRQTSQPAALPELSPPRQNSSRGRRQSGRSTVPHDPSPELSPRRRNSSRGRQSNHRGRGSSGARRCRNSGGQRSAPAEEERAWSSIFGDVSVDPFIQPVGPTVPVTSDPTEVFLQFFTPELIEHIVVETNRYAAECLLATHNGDGPVPEWETSAEEIKAYLGFSILMGLNKLPDLYDYWSTSEVLHYFPVASRISRKRFLEIQRYLHLANNDTIVPRGQPGYDRLAKVRPVIDHVRRACLQNYHPHRENAIDAAMIPFKGRSALKQYLPLKPTKRGFKVWVRADSINGYVCDFDVYTGKDGENVETNLGAKVVKKLSQPLIGGNYHLYFDNFFSSVKLFEDLMDDGIYACGTFRVNRIGIPEAIRDTKLGKLPF